MRTFPKIVIYFSFLFMLMACQKVNETPPESLVQTWEVVEFMSLESVAYPRIEGKKIVFTINSDGTYKLQLEFNQCSGTYQTGNEATISIGATSCTEMCCDSKFAERLVQLLPRVESYKIACNTLQLIVPEWGWISCSRID